MKKIILFISAISIFCNSFSQSDWKPLGPDKVPFNQAGGGAIGIGRVTCLRFHPGYNGTTNKIMFLGSPDGGLWRSSGGGNDWENWHTDHLPVLAISDIAINSKNPSVMYVATCDPDGLFNPQGPCGENQATASRGIFKSADGGLTWDTLPLGNWYDQEQKLLKDFWKYPTLKLIPALKINPANPEILTALVMEMHSNPDRSDGYVFQSKDGGQNWFTKLYVPDGFFRDMELMPGHPNVIYVGGRKIYKSSDGGKKWKIISSFTDSLKEIKTIKIAVTRADPKYLYANVAPLGIIYRSADGGKTFKMVMKGFDNGMYSRFVIETSPLEKEHVFFNNGNYVSHFFADAPKRKLYTLNKGTHADIHDLAVAPDADLLFVSCDGGIYKVEKADSIKWNATDISNGLNVAKIHRMGVSQNSEKFIAGAQDVGTLLYDPVLYAPGNWATISGGDGAEGIIDFTNDSIIYRSDGQGGSNMTRSLNGGKTWSGNLLPRDSPGGGVVKPFFMNAQNPNTLYFGFHDIAKNSDRGNGKWTKLSKFANDFPGTQKGFLLYFSVAPSDSNVIYAAFGNPVWGGTEREKYRLYKTTDEGATWKDITNGLTGVDWSNIYCLAVDPHHPDTVFVGFMGCWIYKMMVSYDGGSTWKNYSEGLPDESDMNSIVIDKSKTDGSMYAGTFRGVFYRNDSTGKWIPFSNGLPNTKINELEINYFNKRLYAATYGMGVWYSKLYGE